MKSVLRATTVEDAPQLTSFLAQNFLRRSSERILTTGSIALEIMGSARGLRRTAQLCVIERNGEIVAHSGIWPMALETKVGMLQGCHMFDWASDARVLGAGVSLLRKFSEMFDFLYANGGSDMTRKIIPSIGFQKFGEAWFAERPLRPLQQMLVRRPLDWKAPARFARNAMRASGPSTAPPEGWSVREGIGEKEIRPRVFETMPSGFRSNGFFRYLQRCPSGQIRIFQVLKEGHPMGRIALSLVHHQLRIIGIWLSDPSSEARCAAYGLALRVAKSMGSAFEIVAMGSRPDSERAVVTCRFASPRPYPHFLASGQGVRSLNVV